MKPDKKLKKKDKKQKENASKVADDTKDATDAMKRKREEKEDNNEDGEDVSDSDKPTNTVNKTTEKEVSSSTNTTDEHDNDEEEEEEDADSIITKSSFLSLGVNETLCQAIKAVNWEFATKIQKETLPFALKGRDVIGLAETGSGKTGAFTIPILQALLENPQRGAVYAVILAPTRELAFQIHEVVSALGSTIGAASVCIVGGVDQASQAIALARNPHVVTATPGRLVDHLTNTKGFSLRKLKYLVMDEADRMLSMDFEQELNQILEVVPDSTEGRRTMLFSATMTSKVQKLQRASLSDPIRIEVSTKFQTPKKLIQNYLFIPAKYKDVYLTYLVNENAGKSMLVFGATCNNVQRIALMLRNLGFPAICLHGQMTQPKRLGALTKFKAGGRDILICTDVASRGLDIPNVDVVINFDLPGHGKDYIHRVGRTARAGKSGRAVAMVTQYDVEVYQRLEGLLGRKLPEMKLDEETVLVLHERVSEAQRMATRELKEQLASNVGRWKKGSRSGKDDDGDGGLENKVKGQLRRGYMGGSGGNGGGIGGQRGSGNKKRKKTHR